MTEIDKETLYRAVKDGVVEALTIELNQQRSDMGKQWIYQAIEFGTKEAIMEIKKNKKR